MDTPENNFLQRLDAADAEAVRPMLARAFIPPDRVVVEQGAPVEHVHLPITAQFANLTRFADGRAVETAVVGPEGMTGLAPFMADRPCAWEIVCRAEGDAWVAPAAPLRELANARPGLMRRLLELTDLYQAQSATTAACNVLHTVPQRVARWILTAADLTPDPLLTFRQDELARLIGARRSTVSEAASALKARRLIAYGRGVIRVLDRGGLEAVSCECHALLKPRLDAVMVRHGSA